MMASGLRPSLAERCPHSPGGFILNWVCKASAGFLALACLSTAAHAAPAPTASRFNASVHVGSNGTGIDGEYLVNDLLTVRGAVDWVPISQSTTEDDLNYKGKIEWASVGLYADLHPFKNGWLVSAGIVGGDRRVALTATPTTFRLVNGQFYSPSELGNVTAKVRLNSPSTFLGLGYDSARRSKSGLTYRVVAGVEFSNPPDVSLRASGTAANTPNLKSYLSQKEDELSHDLAFVTTYPVIEAALGYQF